ncbi:MAG: AAA family ATPase [Pseudomonadales bacterium]|nr:AAA family ATPase [Pseudomonadales bacterium]
MSEHSVDQLKEALNIDREPFSDEGVTGLFFPGAGRQELLEQLQHQSRYGSPLLILTGPEGVGKSTLVAQLEERLDPAVYKTVHIDADVLADDNFLLVKIAEGFGIDLGGQSETAVNALVRHTKELDAYSQTPFIVVDDAQNLSPDAVNFVQLLMSHAGASGFRCLLVVEAEELEKVQLMAPLLAAGIDFQPIELPLLDPAGCNEYLKYRMTTSGLGDIQFNKSQLEQIFNMSQGNPDKINIVARQLLVENFPYKKNQRKQAKLPILHGLLALVIAGLVAVGYLFFPYEEMAPNQVEQLPQSKNALGVESLAMESSSLTTDDTPQGLESSLESSEATNQEPVDKKASSNVELYADDDPQKSVERALDSFALEDVDYNFEETAADHAVEVLQPVVEEAAVKSSDLPNAIQSPGSTSEVRAKEVQVVEVVKGKAKATSNAAAAVKNSVNAEQLTQRERWLMSLDKSKFTLQMLGAREEGSVQKFIAKYPSLKDIAYYRTTHREKDWFVVVYGLYSSKEGAKNELSKLPKALQDSKPWARPISSVQQEIELRKN